MSHEFEDRARQEQELDEYLRGDSEVSQRYREISGRAVPPALDARVLQQAQQQAGKNAQRRKWLRWGAPLAGAATALIAVTVVLQPGVREMASAPAMPEAAPVRDYEAAAALRQAPAPAPEAEDSVLQDSTAGRAAAGPRPPQARKPTPAAQPLSEAAASSERRDASAARQGNSQEAAQREAEAEMIIVTGTSTATAVRSEARGDAPAGQQAQEPALAAEPAKEAQRQMLAGQADPSRSPLPERADVRMRETQVRTLEEQKRKAAGPSSPGANTPAAPAPPAPEPSIAAFEVSPPEPAPEGIATLQADRALPPALWVNWIRGFRREGKQIRADELLARLRAAHPDFQIPPDLAPAERR